MKEYNPELEEVIVGHASANAKDTLLRILNLPMGLEAVLVAAENEIEQLTKREFNTNLWSPLKLSEFISCACHGHFFGFTDAAFNNFKTLYNQHIISDVMPLVAPPIPDDETPQMQGEVLVWLVSGNPNCMKLVNANIASPLFVVHIYMSGAFIFGHGTGKMLERLLIPPCDPSNN